MAGDTFGSCRKFTGDSRYGDKPLTFEEITVIADLLLADVNKRLADRRVTVVLDQKAKEWAAEKGYDPVFGARPLKRFLQRHLETQLARALIAGDVAEDSEITFTVRNDELAPVQEAPGAKKMALLSGQLPAQLCASE